MFAPTKSINSDRIRSEFGRRRAVKDGRSSIKEERWKTVGILHLQLKTVRDDRSIIEIGRLMTPPDPSPPCLFHSPDFIKKTNFSPPSLPLRSPFPSPSPQSLPPISLWLLILRFPFISLSPLLSLSLIHPPHPFPLLSPSYLSLVVVFVVPVHSHSISLNSDHLCRNSTGPEVFRIQLESGENTGRSHISFFSSESVRNLQKLPSPTYCTTLRITLFLGFGYLSHPLSMSQYRISFRTRNPVKGFRLQHPCELSG